MLCNCVTPHDKLGCLIASFLSMLPKGPEPHEHQHTSLSTGSWTWRHSRWRRGPRTAVVVLVVQGGLAQSGVLQAFFEMHGVPVTGARRPGPSFDAWSSSRPCWILGKTQLAIVAAAAPCLNGPSTAGLSTAGAAPLSVLCHPLDTSPVWPAVRRCCS